ncbi:hypothetical protein E2C01_060066 [Portunus trituberculatus]|uniref:Uncharacterized protein n=1 Tax=Portunus trituberculatus TaxID=210409 RepID=A0A5B7H9G2_PORTR|nr:hypothetical protein [Portunus trituberculatus]
MIAGRLANQFGVDGPACVQRFMCELQQRPIHNRTMVGMLLTLLFTEQKGGAGPPGAPRLVGRHPQRRARRPSRGVGVASFCAARGDVSQEAWRVAARSTAGCGPQPQPPAGVLSAEGLCCELATPAATAVYNLVSSLSKQL